MTANFYDYAGGQGLHAREVQVRAP